MKSYSQITFEFSEQNTPPKAEETPSVGVRIKSLKQPPPEEPVAEPVTAHDQNEQPEPVDNRPAMPEAPAEAPKKSTRGRKSLKEIAIEADLVQVPEDEVLFQKQYYPIGEVAAMFGVNQSLIRFWENEFTILQPRKNKKGDRYFRPEDIKNLELIYDLLRRRKLTIEGAKDFLKQHKKAGERFELIRSLQDIRSFLLEVKANL